MWGYLLWLWGAATAQAFRLNLEVPDKTGPARCIQAAVAAAATAAASGRAMSASPPGFSA